jgi:drug/metabolite transporter (DMT)-like permease
VVVALPVAIPLTVIGLLTEPVHVSWPALAGVGYIGLISQFGGFVVWYRGLADAGVARASQLQLAQPVITLVWAVLLLGETVSAVELITAAVVIGCVFVTQRAARAAT